MLSSGANFYFGKDRPSSMSVERQTELNKEKELKPLVNQLIVIKNNKQTQDRKDRNMVYEKGHFGPTKMEIITTSTTKLDRVYRPY